MTMADLGFTENVNKSSGDSQENVFYRRAVQPLMDRYAVLFTYVLQHYFNDDRFVVSWSGFEEAEDFAAQASAYVSLVSAGVISPSVAARLLKLPVEKDIPPYVIVQGQGITFLEDAADPAMRQAANDAKKAGYELAASPPSPANSGDDEENPDEPNGAGEPEKDENQASKRDEEQSPPESGANKESKDDEKPDPADKQGKPGVERAAESDARPEMLQRHTGMMVAFMVKPEIAEQLALPDGEPVEDLHCTLCFLGDMYDTPPQGKLSPATTSDLISVVLGAFAQGAKPLVGHVGGIGRFVNGGDSDAVVALVNAPGLQAFRRRLVDTLETAGYYVASDYDYLPHITLQYVDASEPTPDVDLPGSMLADDGGMLPAALIFDEICLAIGDDRYTFPLGKVTNDATDALYAKHLEDSLEKTENPDFFGQAGEKPGHPQKPSWPWRLS